MDRSLQTSLVALSIAGLTLSASGTDDNLAALEGAPVSSAISDGYSPLKGPGDVRLLYERYRRSVFARARGLLGNDAAAKDAMQEVFLRLLSQQRDVFATPSPMAWLYRVTTNLCLNILRDEKRRTELLFENAANDVVPGDAEARAIVRGILRLVPVDVQETAVCYHLDEMSQDEISDLMGVSRRTVGNRLLAFKSIVDTVVERDRAS